MPLFVTVANGSIREDVVIAGNEAVLTARFEDADFFYNLDMKKNLRDFRPLLKGTMFQKDLGTMLDKSERTEALVGRIAGAMGLGRAEAIATQAAHVSRADLATSVVTEVSSPSLPLPLPLSFSLSPSLSLSPSPSPSLSLSLKHWD